MSRVNIRVRCMDCQVEYVTSYDGWKARECTCPECRSSKAYGLKHPREKPPEGEPSR